MSNNWETLKHTSDKQAEKASDKGAPRPEKMWWTGLFTMQGLRDALAMSGNPPYIDARGVAIGLLVALGVPIGAHTLILVLLRFFIRYNVGLAFAVTWIVNPLTIIPLYSAYYYVGSSVLGEPQTLGLEQFRQVMESIIRQRHFWESLKEFFLLDLEVLERWAITATVVSVVSAVTGYAVTYRVQSRRSRHPREHS